MDIKATLKSILREVLPYLLGVIIGSTLMGSAMLGFLQVLIVLAGWIVIYLIAEKAGWLKSNDVNA